MAPISVKQVRRLHTSSDLDSQAKNHSTSHAEFQLKFRENMQSLIISFELTRFVFVVFVGSQELFRYLRRLRSTPRIIGSRCPTRLR
ncbi:hypothetical protein CUJ84_pRLN3000067 (plasmid) [Rhizobium leguminosarum]|uniref:Uncharacterized protein n=1 Tax=Rhizobium leguminosarum TaxID=384 RepID=A0A2K9ZG24_RHILE|nr:hypothetical protein CUJ84_pRLN3000067 [Rhizobium leguminosarum]